MIVIKNGENCGPGKVLWTSSEWDGSRPWWDRGPRNVPWTSTQCDVAWWPQTVVKYAGWERFHEPRVNEMTLCGDTYSTWTSKVPLAKRASSNHRVLLVKISNSRHIRYSRLLLLHRIQYSDHERLDVVHPKDGVRDFRTCVAKIFSKCKFKKISPLIYWMVEHFQNERENLIEKV